MTKKERPTVRQIDHVDKLANVRNSGPMRKAQMRAKGSLTLLACSASVLVGLGFLTSCVTKVAPDSDRNCFAVKVIVTADDGRGRLIAPGVPIDVLVRSRRGNVLKAVRTGDNGEAACQVCWRDDDPASQIEARLGIGPQFVGSMASFFNYSNTYCLTLPNRIGGHCGEGGTGPNDLLLKGDAKP